MSDRCYRIALSHAELVSLYLALSRREEELDRLQADVLDRVAGELYAELSVSEMEAIESYYEAIVAARSRSDRV
ncbi:MAG: hypothetical protein ACOC2D_11145 [Spirochaetota bacterium]